MGRRDKRPTRKQADLGVLFVHGIGQQKPGETLVGFGEPLIEWISDRLRKNWGTGGELSPDPCPDCHLAMHHQHLLLRARSADRDEATQKSWIFAECYWDDVVKSVEVNAFSRWVGLMMPPLVLWQAATSMLGGFRRRRHVGWRWNPLSWYAFLCNSFWNVTLRPVAAYFLMLLSATSLLPAPDRKLENRPSLGRFASMLVVVADTYSFAADEEVARLIRRRFWNAFTALRRDCRRVVVVAHSQGGAIAHATLKEHGVAPAAFVGLGSGLGPLGLASRTRPGSGRLAHYRLLVTVFFGMTTCVMAGVAFFYVLAVATLLLLLVFAALLAGLLLITDSLAEGTHKAADLLRTSSQGLRDEALLRRAFILLENDVAHALIMSAFAGCFLLVTIRLLFGRRSQDAPKGRSAVELPGLPRDRWYEFYSPLDPVSIGTPANEFATTYRVQNPTSWRIWREHTGYLEQGGPVLPLLADLLATVGEVVLGHGSTKRSSSWSGRVRRLGVASLSIGGWLLVFFGSMP